MSTERDPQDPTPTSKELEAVLDETLHERPDGAFLLVLSGEHPGRLFPLDRPERVIGRGRHADIRIEQVSISYRHARIASRSGGYWVEDLGSTNGTFLNEKRITAEVPLRGGDVLRVGETTLSFLLPREHGELPTVSIEHVPMGLSRRHVPSSIPPDGATYRGRQSSYPEFQVRNVGEGPSLRELIGKVVAVSRFVRRNGRSLAVGALFVAALGGVSAILLPPAATAEFEVRLTPKTAANPVQQFDGDHLEFFSSAETTFRSPELLRVTLAALGENPVSDDLLLRTRDRIKFESTALQTYRGSYTDATPAKALGFLQRHVKAYLDSQIEKTLKVIRAEVTFLKGQLDQNEAELSRTENALKEFKQSHTDGLPEQAEGQFSARLALKQRQTDLAAQVDRATLELASARERLSRDDPALDQKVQSSKPYEQAIVEVNRKLSEARGNGLGEDHPDVVRLKRQAEELTRLSEQAVSADVSDLSRRTDPQMRAMKNRVADLEVQKNAAGSELARVNQELKGLDKVAKELPEVEAKYAELTRSYSATKELHTKLFERFKAAQLQLELERASEAARYEILTAPEVKKVSPRKTAAIRVGLGAVLGLILALCVVLFGEAKRYVRENY